MNSEKAVKERVKKTLKDMGASYLMPVQSGMGRAGASDFLVCYRGLFFAIETKYGKGKPTALQLQYGAEVQKAGGSFMLVYETNVHTMRPTMEYTADNYVPRRL